MAKREYIDREAARLAYEKSLANNNHRIEGASAIHRQEHRHILHILEKLPAADVVEVMHGEWVAKDLIVRSPFARNHYCSVCQYEPIETKSYCPECGAKMDGERKDKP